MEEKFGSSPAHLQSFDSHLTGQHDLAGTPTVDIFLSNIKEKIVQIEGRAMGRLMGIGTPESEILGILEIGR
jgi:hypothetical protein